MDNPVMIVRSWESPGFQMQVDLAMLPRMQLRKLQKLFRLTHRSPELNKEAWERLGQWLETYCQTTKEQWAIASKAYQRGYRTPPDGRSRARRGEAKRVRANNEALLRAVKQAKAAHEKAVKMQKYFTEERNF